MSRAQYTKLENVDESDVEANMNPSQGNNPGSVGGEGTGTSQGGQPMHSVPLDEDAIVQPETVTLPPPYADNNDLPTYDEVERIKYEEETRDNDNVWAPLLGGNGSLWVPGGGRGVSIWGDQMDIGADSTFLLTFLISLMFSWVGFMLTFCVSNSLAGRYGAISGFGLSLVKWTLIMSHSNYDMKTPSPAPAPAADGAQDDPQKFQPAPEANMYWFNAWVWWLLIVLGMTIFVRGIFMYVRAKQVARASASASTDVESNEESSSDSQRNRFSLFYFN